MHDTVYAFRDIINECEVSVSIAVIEDLRLQDCSVLMEKGWPYLKIETIRDKLTKGIILLPYVSGLEYNLNIKDLQEGLYETYQMGNIVRRRCCSSAQGLTQDETCTERPEPFRPNRLCTACK